VDRRLWTAGGGTATRCMVRVPCNVHQCMIACAHHKLWCCIHNHLYPMLVRRVILASINNSSLVASSLPGLVAKRMGQVLRLRHGAAVHHLRPNRDQPACKPSILHTHCCRSMRMASTPADEAATANVPTTARAGWLRASSTRYADTGHDIQTSSVSIIFNHHPVDLLRTAGSQ
jgi:hypothetical protein